MKTPFLRLKSVRILAAAVAVIAAAALLVFLPSCAGEDSSSSVGTSCSVTKYDILYEMQTDHTACVTETIEMDYTGRYSSGFTRYIPVTSASQARDIKVYEISEDDSGHESLTDTYYTVETSGEKDTVEYPDRSVTYKYIEVSIGDDEYKYGETHTYRITYTYSLLYSSDGYTDYITIDAVGTRWDSAVSNVSLTVTYPGGLKSGQPYMCYTGDYNLTIDGNCDETSFYIEMDSLTRNTGITLLLYFDGGTFSSRANFLPWLFVILGVVLLAAAVLTKYFLFRDRPGHDGISPDAAKTRDPLELARILGKKIRDTDVVDLVYYWAEKGYLRISLKNKNNPVLIKTADSIDGEPIYQQALFADIFSYGDRTTAKAVAAKVYPTVSLVRQSVNRKKTPKYNRGSIAAALVIALLAGVLAALMPIVLPTARISAKLFEPLYLLIILPPIAISALGLLFIGTRRKNSRSANILYGIAILVIGAVCVVSYCVFIPSLIAETAPRIILSILSFAVSAASSLLLIRRRDYAEEYDGAAACRVYIGMPDMDTADGTMTDGDPAAEYFAVLPYAEALDLDGQWDRKFMREPYAVPVWLLDSSPASRTRLSATSAELRECRDTLAEIWVTRPAEQAERARKAKKGRKR